MNKTYRLIWNEVLKAWVAVAEIAKARGKRSSKALLLAGTLVAVSPAPTFALAPPPTELPTGGNVVAGSATISQSGAVMNITQSTQRAAIDWNTFNIGSGAQVNFIQPSSSAVALNRVLSANPSQIFGQLNANGQVFLTNASGIYFAPGSNVNVGALVATTHSISNADFMAGNYKFTRNGATGSVINEGNLTADLNGYIALLAPEVRNQGVVIAQAGTVALAAGETITLQMTSNNTLANIEVEPATIAALVENGNAVQAPGGLIILSARAADQLQGSVVKNSGTLEASSLVERGGVIRLEGDHITLTGTSQINATGATGGGEVYVGGEWQGTGSMHQATTVTMDAGATIDVSATKVGDGGTAVLWSDLNKPDGATRVYGALTARGGDEGGDGGRIETSGHYLNMRGQVDLSAPYGKNGLLLLDPKNIIIATSNPGGGATSCTSYSSCDGWNDNAAGTSWITPANLVTWLNSGYVSLQVSNDITVSNEINSTANANPNDLSLSAGRSILVNADIKLKGSFFATANRALDDLLTNRESGPANFTMAAGTSIDTTATPSSSNGSIDIAIQTLGAAGTATIYSLKGPGNNNHASSRIAIRADSVRLLGGPNSIGTDIANNSDFYIAPQTLTRPMVIGGATGDETGKLVIDASEFAALKDGFRTLYIGNSYSPKLNLTGGITPRRPSKILQRWPLQNPPVADLRRSEPALRRE